MGYRFGNDGKKINNLLFLDDLKLYGKDQDELEKLVDVVSVFSSVEDKVLCCNSDEEGGGQVV